MPRSPKKATKPPKKPKKVAKPKAPPRQPVAARAAEIHARLAAAIPTPVVELDFQSPWQLLVATILSAQSTDKTVNKVTPGLFQRYPTPAALGAAPQEEVEAIVLSTGFFRNKAKAIREASAMIAERHGGEVPRELEALVELPGVARKTANVVLGSAFRVPSGFVVDTHVGRVARRLKLTSKEDPVEVEQALMKLTPREAWIDAAHRMVLHGRYVCLAKSPSCAACPINELCASREALPEGEWTARAAAEGRRVALRGAGPD